MNFHRTNQVYTPITHSNLTYENVFAGISEIFDRSVFDCGTAACPSFARGRIMGYATQRIVKKWSIFVFILKYYSPLFWVKIATVGKCWVQVQREQRLNYI